MLHFPAAVGNLSFHKSLLSPFFKYKHVPRFRHKIDARTNILNSMIPEEYKVIDEDLFHTMYTQGIHHMLGCDILSLRIYHYFLRAESIDSIDINKLNTVKLRHDFINQFNHLLDSKNQLTQYKLKNTIKTYKIEKHSRQRILPSLIGLVYTRHGIDKAQSFVDEWVIMGQWSGKDYKHKGLVELYTEKSLRLF